MDWTTLWYSSVARAHAVWLVTVNDKPSHAFTVKHEAQSWLLRERAKRNWSIYRVFRLPDGHQGDPAAVELNVVKFINGER